MARCKDCIHDKVCDEWAVTSGIPFVNSETCEHFTPTADVVPKSEVVREVFKALGVLIPENATLEEAVESYKKTRKITRNMAITNAKAEVAREIFEELVREVYSKIPDKILPVTFGEMSRHLDYSDGLNFGSRNAYFDTLKIIAELKKKYTEDA